MASLSVKSWAMTAKTDRRCRPHGWCRVGTGESAMQPAEAGTIVGQVLRRPANRLSTVAPASRPRWLAWRKLLVPSRCHCQSRGMGWWWRWVTQSDLRSVNQKRNVGQATDRKKDYRAADQPIGGPQQRSWRSISLGAARAKVWAAAAKLRRRLG
jgi:hypothetical protein